MEDSGTDTEREGGVQGEFRGIGLVEVTWKVVAVILHRRLTAGIKLHLA